MRWFRRRRPRFDPAHLHASTELVPRTERAIVALAFHAQQLHDRVERLERRVDETEESNLALPSHDDVLEVRLHSAKVAAELTRVTVELRAEIEHVAASVTSAAGVRGERVRNLAETIIDLSDRLDTLPDDHGQTERAALG